MKKFFQKIYYGFKCLKDRYNKLSDEKKQLIKFGICIVVLFISLSLLLLCKYCA